MYTQGYFGCAYKTLVRIFGEPEKSIGNDDRVMWSVVFKNGTKASIYDWRTTGPINRNLDWHIGGYTKEAVICVINEIQRRLNKTLLDVALAWPSRPIQVISDGPKISKQNSTIRFVGLEAKKFIQGQD